MFNTTAARRLLIVASVLAGVAAAGASRLYAERVAAAYYQDPQCLQDNCGGGSTGCEILANGKECLKGAAS